MFRRILLLFALFVVDVLCQPEYQPKVDVVHKGKAMTFIGFPDGSPWCEGRPTYMWLVHNNTRPWCLGKNGKWNPNKRHGVNNCCDLHPCVSIDIDIDGVFDLACVVGAGSGKGVGYNQFYITDPDTGILGKRLEGPNDLQKYPGMRTRYFIKVKAADGAELVMITTIHGKREDGKPNQHRMFRQNGPYKFDEVKGPWIQHTTYDCVVAGDLNGDGIEDVVVCDPDRNGWLYIQNKDLSWRGIDLEFLGKKEIGWRDARIADVTGDGIADLITIGPSSPWRGGRKNQQHVRIFKGDPKLPRLFDFDDPYFEHFFEDEARAVEVIDVNGDGRLDIYVLLNDGNAEHVTRCRKIPTPKNLWPPIDTARDVLFVATKDKKPKPFVPVEMKHALIGCQGHLAKWDNRTLALGQGGFSREGANVLLKWSGAPTPDPNSKLPGESHRWRFNNNVKDSVGDANGSREGGAGYTSQAVEGNKALLLPGGQSQMIVENNALKEPFSRITVSLWFYATDLGGVRYLFEEGGSKNGLGIRLKENVIEVACIAGSGKVESISGASISQKTWHHTAAVFRNGQLRIYLDGKREGTASTAYSEIPFHGDPMTIGGPGLKGGKSPHFDGFIDDVRIWRGTALNDAQVRTLFYDI